MRSLSQQSTAEARTAPGGAPRAATAVRTVAGYRLLWRLGAGGFGEVWQGQHEQSGELAAVKLIVSENAAARAQFRNEARAIARLWHPHIVNLFDVGDDFLVTAFIDGDDLRKRLRTPLDPALAIRMTAQIASALDHAHRNGVVHCDVKPANILIDANDSAYLADFGVATFLEGPGEEIRGGTPAYMPPEQRAGERPTPAADQYALARTLLHMLLLEIPPDGEGALALLPSRCPEPLRQALRRALDPDPGARFASMAELGAALEGVDVAALGHRSVLAAVQRPTAPYRWAAAALGVTASSPQVQEADFTLSSAAARGLIAADELARYTARSGYRDQGWTVYVRADRLGSPDRPEALARAASLVVILPGLAYSRHSWQPVAQAICRDNAQTAVIAVDVHGFGDSAYAESPPASERLTARGMMEGVLAWLDVLGLRAIPTCLVAHSLSTLPLLSVTDDELGPLTNRLAICPLVPFANPVWRRICFGAPLLDRWPRLLKWAIWPVNLSRLRSAMSELDGATRDAAVRELDRYPERTLGRAGRHWPVARPVPGEAMRRAKWLSGTADEIVPRRYTEAAATALGFDRGNLHWSISNDHYPHLPKREHPEETSRNIDQIARMVKLLLRDVDRPAEMPASSGATEGATMTGGGAEVLGTRTTKPSI
jgi:serine/threonine-protein kinase